jgi:lipid A ethanolaminephosphotransferase
VRETYLESEAIEVVGQDTVIDRDRPGRVVGVVLVGESARADPFSLNGYERRTNPKLEQRPLIVFPHASSPGTSTANSVPAMFTFVEAARYTPRKAQHQTSVLDLLEQVGVEVHWIDNNSSSKGAYEGTGYERLTADEPYLEFVDGSGALHDDVFFEDLARLIAEAPGDVVVVLHCMGSHGPAYHRRYPEAFEVFQPSCTLDAPQQCNNTELVNAYDNTILYTDHIADRVIDVLETLDPDDRSFMLYASDHGESLGENGVYLHGFPVFMAPDAQTHVGMFAWMSDRAAAPDRQEEGEPTFSLDERVVTHFDLAHTLMDLFGARSTIVDPTRVLLHWQSSRGAPPGELVDGFDVDSN